MTWCCCQNPDGVELRTRSACCPVHNDCPDPCYADSTCDKRIAEHRGQFKVYVAGPITKGDVFDHCGRAMRVGTAIMLAGLVPFVPHTSAIWAMVSNIGYEQWMRWDFAWIRTCHAMVRLPGESSGSDRETELASELGIPVFYLDESGVITDLLAWVDAKMGDENSGT